MAMEHCLLLQMNTTAPITRARVPLQCNYHINAINFGSQNCRVSKRLSVQASASRFGRSSTARTARLVCNAAVNEVQVVTDSSWKTLVIGNEAPVLVEFWAPWCGPCRMIAPVIDELAKEYSGKLACFKVNTDECPNIASELGIRSIPTVIFFKNGEKKESVIGAVPKSTLSATIDKYVEV